MSGSTLRGLGSVVVAALVTTLTAVAPAHAANATGTIAGTITDNGTPVPYTSIYVSSDDGTFNDSTTTSETGEYEVRNVPAAVSAYRIMISAPGHPIQYAPSKTSYDTGTLYSVTDGGRTVVDDTLLPTGTISGRFTDSAGNGVGGVWIDVTDAVGGSTASGAPADFDGNYSVAVWPGTYAVAFYFGSGQRQYAYGQPDRETATLFTVAVGQTVTVNDVKLGTGTVTGQLTKPDGSPAAGYFVRAEGDGSSGYGRTNESGTYTIADLLPGSYRVAFELPSGANQWAHQAVSRDAAQLFDLTSGVTTVVDEQLLPTGSVAGRFTDQAGQGMGGVQVSLSVNDGNISTETAADGSYRIDDVLPGTYQVQFYDWRSNLNQFAYGKLSPETADPITVTANQTTTVDDSRLATGTVRVTAKDSLTGAAIDSFWSSIGDQIVNSTGGAVVLTDVPVGTHRLSASADGYVYEHDAASVTVTAGQQTDVQITLRPYAKISTRVTDRATGAGVPNVCVSAQKVKTFVFQDGCERTDSTGAVTLSVADPDSYNLFVLPSTGSPYGAQWVGPDGGTGEQDAARRITVATGETKSAPKIKLDPRGTITGTVSSHNGAPVRNGFVGIVGPDTGVGTDTRYSEVAADGSYSIDWLGPYQWPLQFKAADYPFQWSGGVGNRLNAQTVLAGQNQPTDFDYTLKQGATLVVTVPDDPGWGRAIIRNAVTRDPIAIIDSESFATGAQTLVLGGQKVKIQYAENRDRWYGGTDFDSATAVTIPRTGTVQIAFPPAS
ncbi:carboxypeptidase regulatory-like domain-containing protein [Micromonospora sp. NPDC049523]|uniref:carboxypeptidase regulatory-like domain-containing protein n=1 Tax=Micromonospora sp. NPDC049523 TaxID=3155921 RepID=UPI00341B8CD6